MRRSGQKFSLSLWLIGAVVAAGMLWVGGCGDFLGEKSTGAQVKKIIDDLSRIELEPEPNIPMPEVYRQPPEIIEQIVGGAPEFKLVYFCRHHISDELKKIIHEQFATEIFQKANKPPTVVPDYTVSSVPATNQLIVRCPLREDADAVLELLEMIDVPPIQVKIHCIISEVYADRTLDWQTTLQIEELFGEEIWVGGAAQKFGTTVSDLLTEGDWLPAFPGASLRELARSKMGLKMGYWKTDKYLALVDLLESQGYLKILMNPILETVNGKLAKVSQTQEVPLQQTFLRRMDSDYYETKIEYKIVTDSLEVTPHVFGDGYIGLETKIILGSKLTPEGVKQLPIITMKEIENKENRIRPGESLVIGGLRKSEKRDVIRGVPFLKDIPGIGILFSGRDFEERVVETIYILTPTISTGGIPRKEMMEEVKRKHEADKKQRDKTLEAEQSRLEAEAEKAEARAAVREADQRAQKAEAEAEQATTKVEEATAAEQQAKTEAEEAKAEAKTATEKATAAEKQAQAQIEKLKAETEKLKAEAEKAKADTQKAAVEVEKARAEAEKATAEAEKAKADVQKATAETEKAKADAQRATAETEKAKADAQRAMAEAEKAKADAQRATAEAEKSKADAEKAMAEAEAKAEAAEKARAEAEAERPKQEGEAKDKAEAQKLKAEAEKLKAEAEKAKADAERLMAEAEKAKAEAETKAKAAEKAKAEADAKAKAAEKAEAEKPEEEVAKKARAKKDKADGIKEGSRNSQSGI